MSQQEVIDLTDDADLDDFVSPPQWHSKHSRRSSSPVVVSLLDDDENDDNDFQHTKTQSSGSLKATAAPQIFHTTPVVKDKAQSMLSVLIPGSEKKSYPCSSDEPDAIAQLVYRRITTYFKDAKRNLEPRGKHRLKEAVKRNLSQLRYRDKVSVELDGLFGDKDWQCSLRKRSHTDPTRAEYELDLCVKTSSLAKSSTPPQSAGEMLVSTALANHVNTPSPTLNNDGSSVRNLGSVDKPVLKHEVVVKNDNNLSDVAESSSNLVSCQEKELTKNIIKPQIRIPAKKPPNPEMYDGSEDEEFEVDIVNDDGDGLTTPVAMEQKPISNRPSPIKQEHHAFSRSASIASAAVQAVPATSHRGSSQNTAPKESSKEDVKKAMQNVIHENVQEVAQSDSSTVKNVSVMHSTDQSTASTSVPSSNTFASFACPALADGTNASQSNSSPPITSSSSTTLTTPHATNAPPASTVHIRARKLPLQVVGDNSNGRVATISPSESTAGCSRSNRQDHNKRNTITSASSTQAPTKPRKRPKVLNLATEHRSLTEEEKDILKPQRKRRQDY